MPKFDAPIFIVGAPRSGTTLTARLLGAHSNIFMPGETHFLDDIYSRRHQLGSPEQVESRDALIARLETLYHRLEEFPDQARIDRLFSDGQFPSALSQCETYKDLFATFMEVQMKSEGKLRWGNQVPREVFEITLLMEMFPGAKIIGCLRDPRDFLLSYREKWRRESEDTALRLKKLYHPIITSMLWRKSNKALEQALGRYPGSVMISRYEDLVGDPENSLQELCDFIGETFEPNMLDTDFSNSSAQIQEVGIFKTGIDRWQGQLPEEDIFFAQVIGQKSMRQFHYAKSPTHSRTIPLAGLFLSTPVKLVQALHANRAIRGPLLPYLWKRLRPS